MTDTDRPLNLFATVLTYAAPSSNYRGESEENRTVLQKITKGGKETEIKVAADGTILKQETEKKKDKDEKHEKDKD